MPIEAINTTANPVNLPPSSNRPPRTEESAVRVDGRSPTRVAAQAPAPQVQAVQPPASRDDVNGAVEKLNEVAANLGNSIQFSVDSDTRKNIVKLVDLESKEVIRQIPTEEAVAIAKAIDRFQGLLIKDKA